MLDEELVNNIRNFGLTLKQAKIYAAAIISPNCEIAEISNKTGLYSQDIYKILISLERMGLVTRVESKPIRVMPVDIAFALNKLVELQEQRIKNQKNNVQRVIEAIRKRQIQTSALKEKFVILHANSQTMKNKVDLVFKKMRKTYDVISPEDTFLKYHINYFLDRFSNFVRRKVKTRILILGNNDDSNLSGIVAGVKWPPCDITIKKRIGLRTTASGIADGKELWSTIDKTHWGTVIFTDYDALVQMAKENFNVHWENPESKTIFHQNANETNRFKNEKQQDYVESNLA